MTQEHLRRMPLRRLRELAADVESVIHELESSTLRREIDIAEEHDGNASLIHSVVRKIGNEKTGRWRQVEWIYCCSQHCPRCPHGEFVFRYRRNRRKHTTNVSFVGMPALDDKTLEWMRSTVRQAVPYVVHVSKDDLKK
jgi:hypothetical protein